jgi:hypothetical protein
MSAPAGYSGTPLWQQLGLKPGQRLLVMDPPKDFESLLADAPQGIVWLSRAAPFDAAVLFANTVRAQETQLARVLPKFASGGMLWLAWPKKASGVASDLSDETVRRIGLAAGLVDIKVCAVDATWSALKFVHRHGRTL